MQLRWISALVLMFIFAGCVTDAIDRNPTQQGEGRVTDCEPTQQEDVYIIDSKPQGLRVVVDDFERGVTPCVLKRKDYSYAPIIDIEVMPATEEQLRDYCIANKKVVSIFRRVSQSKRIKTNIPGGTLLFDFIKKEYDAPTNEEEREWVLEEIERDGVELEREREDYRQRIKAYFEKSLSE